MALQDVAGRTNPASCDDKKRGDTRAFSAFIQPDAGQPHTLPSRVVRPRQPSLPLHPASSLQTLALLRLQKIQLARAPLRR